MPGGGGSCSQVSDAGVRNDPSWGSPPHPRTAINTSAESQPRARACGRLLLLVVAWGMVAALLMVAAGAAWFQRMVLRDLPDVQGIVDYKPPQATRLLDGRGAEIDVLYVERRFWVPLGSLPSHVPAAFVAAEDQRFWQHGGVDPPGIVRAARANYAAGEVVQGGSTITQQLVKNLLVGDERQFVRKLREAVLARQLEQRLSKDAILELYLNYVFLGAGNYGIDAAAWDYFGVSARHVDVGQAALLAGLVKAPSRGNPRQHPQQARQARADVLARMQALAMIDPTEAERARALPVVVPPAESVAQGGLSFLTAARREVRARYGAQAATAGLTVHTTMDPRVQALAEQGVALAVRGLLNRQGLGGVRGEADLEAWAARPAPSTGVGDCFEARIRKRGALDALDTGAGPMALRPEERRATLRALGGRVRADRLPAGTVLGVCALEDGVVALDPRPWAQGAAVVLENSTGRILAVVGGRNVSLDGFDRATQALRQPGSAFKPFVYAAALHAGKSRGDLVDTSYLTVRTGRRRWSPRDSISGGFIPLADALAFSSNRAAVRLLQEVGAPRVVRTAQAMGIRSALRPDAALALGASEVTILDMAAGYAAIARGGRTVEPTLIDRVVRPDGTDEPWPRQQPRQVLPPGVAYELLDMMRGVVERGTGRAARREGLDRAGKTGTTNDAIDTWFVGFTPEHTVAVWVGSDEPVALGRGESGGHTALPGWTHIVDALQGSSEDRFPRPPEMLLIPEGSGAQAYRRGTAPRRVLRLHSLGDEPLPAFPGYGE